MKVMCMTLGMIGTHCYILENENTKEALVVDPADHADLIEKKLNEKGLTLKGILLTHGHADHIMAVPELKEKHGVPLLAHKDEKDTLENPNVNLSTSLFRKGISIKADQWLRDGEEIDLAGIKLKVFHTPGHTVGSCCFYNEEDKILLSGDTLFAGSVGRTDFPGGSMRTIINSIKTKLLPLPDEVNVLPGHESLTTMADEKKYNPYFR